MGYLISRLIAEAVLQRLKRAVFAVISPKFSKGFADDTFVIIKEDNFSTFHQLLNATSPGSSLMMESVTENKLPFLDVLVHELPSETFEKSVHSKATIADIVPHYDSNYPTSHMRCCVNALFI